MYKLTKNNNSSYIHKYISEKTNIKPFKDNF